MRDLLVAARMPLDLDREKLLQGTLALREELKAAQDTASAASSVRWRPACCMAGLSSS